MSKKISNYRYYGISVKQKSFFVRFAAFLAAPLMRFLYRPQYHNSHYIPQNAGYMLMGNHVSFLDPVLVHLTVPDYVYWVSKKELFQTKFLRNIFRKLEMIPLDRDQVDINAMKTIRNHIKEGNVIGLFPQGTRVDPENYLDYLPQAGVSAICTKYKMMILPVYLDGPYRLFRKNHIYFGAPFCLNPNISASNKQEKNQLLSNEIMRRCYALVGKAYL